MNSEVASARQSVLTLTNESAMPPFIQLKRMEERRDRITLLISERLLYHVRDFRKETGTIVRIQSIEPKDVTDVTEPHLPFSCLSTLLFSISLLS